VERLRTERTALLAWRDTAAPHTSFFLGAHATVRIELQAYLLGLLSAAISDFDEAERQRNRLLLRAENQSVEPDFARALAESLRGHIANARGQREEALRILRGVVMKSRPEYVTISPFFSRAHDRFTIARLNQDLGHRDDAIRWYRTLLEGSDFPYAAPAHQALSQLYTEAGDTTRSRLHNAEFHRLTRR
jgi:tetratricopeptide (TPR) repeat protein